MQLWDRLRRLWTSAAPVPEGPPYEYSVEALGDDPYLVSVASDSHCGFTVALPEGAVGANVYSGSGRFVGFLPAARTAAKDA
jgi:hypothetical protein